MNPTGSGLERCFACPASCVIAKAGYVGHAAVSGTENHDKIQAGDRSKPVVAEVLADAEDVRQEVAYALDVETSRVREIGVNIGRDYGALASTEIALTVDLECRKAGTWWVVDWKSRERVTQPRNNWQIRSQAIAVMTRHGADSIIGGLGYLDDSVLEVAPFDAFDLPGYWGELRRLLARLRELEAKAAAGGVLDVSAGSWCKYCPAVPYCPAHTRLALALLGELESVDKAMADLSVEQCGRAWELLKRYDVIAERVKESIRARARTEFIPMPNGRRLALIESKRRGLDTKRAVEMLGDEAPYKTTFFTQVREVNVKEEPEC